MGEHIIREHIPHYQSVKNTLMRGGVENTVLENTFHSTRVHTSSLFWSKYREHISKRRRRVLECIPPPFSGAPIENKLVRGGVEY
jgi:hypothetical protein